eukprot:2195308-Rhodomonas_salina.2
MVGTDEAVLCAIWYCCKMASTGARYGALGWLVLRWLVLTEGPVVQRLVLTSAKVVPTLVPTQSPVVPRLVLT